MLQTLPLPTAKCYMFHWEKDNFGKVFSMILYCICVSVHRGLLSHNMSILKDSPPFSTMKSLSSFKMTDIFLIPNLPNFVFVICSFTSYTCDRKSLIT